MSLLLVVLLIVVGFFWLLNRSAKAGYGRFLFWLMWLIGGLCAALAVPAEHPPGTALVFAAWLFWLLFIPLQPLLRKLYRRYREGA